MQGYEKRDSVQHSKSQRIQVVSHQEEQPPPSFLSEPPSYDQITNLSHSLSQQPANQSKPPNRQQLFVTEFLSHRADPSLDPSRRDTVILIQPDPEKRMVWLNFVYRWWFTVVVAISSLSWISRTLILHRFVCYGLNWLSRSLPRHINDLSVNFVFFGSRFEICIQRVT